MKKGDKIICIRNNRPEHSSYVYRVSLGGVYTLLEDYHPSEDQCIIRNDLDIIGTYSMYFFTSLKTHRNKKIDGILE